MIQLRPTAESATKARQVLDAAGVRANVAKQRYACRVVVFSWADRAKAIAALTAAGFSSAAGVPLSRNEMFAAPAHDAGRFELNAYEVAA